MQSRKKQELLPFGFVPLRTSQVNVHVCPDSCCHDNVSNMDATANKLQIQKHGCFKARQLYLYYSRHARD